MLIIIAKLLTNIFILRIMFKVYYINSVKSDVIDIICHLISGVLF